MEIDKLTGLMCAECGISINEYHSSFRYGRLSDARHMVVYALYLLGQNNSHISRLTGFSRPYISAAIRKINYNQRLLIENILRQNGFSE